MAEWFKAAVLKTAVRKHRGFESYSLRQRRKQGEMAESAEGARLLSECRLTPYRGFESLSLRHIRYLAPVCRGFFYAVVSAGVRPRTACLKVKRRKETER